MPDDKFTLFAHKAVAGIPDLELRQEASVAILARLAQAVSRLAANGVPADDCAARAIAEMGDPTALSAECSARYHTRIRPRKLARGLSFLLVLIALPIFFVVAIWLIANSMPASRILPHIGDVYRWALEEQRLDASHPALFQFDHRTQNLLAGWQAQPNNIVYLANYAESAVNGNRIAPISTIEHDVQLYRQSRNTPCSLSNQPDDKYACLPITARPNLECGKNCRFGILPLSP